MHCITMQHTHHWAAAAFYALHCRWWISTLLIFIGFNCIRRWCRKQGIFLLNYRIDFSPKHRCREYEFSIVRFFSLSFLFCHLFICIFFRSASLFLFLLLFSLSPFSMSTSQMQLRSASHLSWVHPNWIFTGPTLNEVKMYFELSQSSKIQKSPNRFPWVKMKEFFLVRSFFFFFFFSAHRLVFSQLTTKENCLVVIFIRSILDWIRMACWMKSFAAVLPEFAQQLHY